MKTVNIFVSLLLVLTTFTSCSKDDEEEYEPMVASALLNTLFIEIVDKNGEVIDYDNLLSEGKLSVIGQMSKQEKKIRITNYQGKKVIDVSADLPDQKHMVFNTDKTEGHGKTDLLLEINDKKFTISVNFDFHSANEPNLIGGSSIYIKDIEYEGKTIIPTEYLLIYSIRIRLTDDKPIIEPL